MIYKKLLHKDTLFVIIYLLLSMLFVIQPYEELHTYIIILHFTTCSLVNTNTCNVGECIKVEIDLTSYTSTIFVLTQYFLKFSKKPCKISLIESYCACEYGYIVSQ